MTPNPALVHIRPDGTVTERLLGRHPSEDTAPRPIGFAIDVRKLDLGGPVHVFDPGAASRRSRCGKLRLDSRHTLTQLTAPPASFRFCRHCNHTGRYDPY